MRIQDILGFASVAIKSARTRTLLMLLAMAIGVASVVLLTALGEGARRFVMGEFASLGTNLLIVLPGRSETTGGPSMFVGATTRDLTIDDAMALRRHPAIGQIAPLAVGVSPVSYQAREREVPILGATAELLSVRHWTMARGRFLSRGDPFQARSECVLGGKVASELFGREDPLGKLIRLGDRRFRVIGILESEGRSIGVDVDELAIIPVASALSLLNSPSLFRILVEVNSHEAIPRAKDFVVETLAERHQGEKDVTVITQDAVLATFDRILRALTLTVAGIASISLAVAGVLIMNIMLITVSQRTKEVGLLKAIGAAPRQILWLFLTEAAMLSSLGAILGLAVGQGGAWLLARIYPALPATAPLWSFAAAIVVALCVGLVFGVMPARRAARLDPVEALAKR
jgi:putative ABC transport system permease protein